MILLRVLAKHSVALRIINNLRIMLNYSLDFSMSSLIAICTISCLYNLFVQIDHDPTITSCLYLRESVTYRLADCMGSATGLKFGGGGQIVKII